MTVCVFILGMREKGRKAGELAAAANQSAARTLEKVLGLSLRVANTSGDLSRVNATVQETNDLLRSSTMTSTSVGLLSPLKACSLLIGREPGGTRRQNANVLPCRFPLVKERGPGNCTLPVCEFFMYSGV